jgi:hypothetical protein
MKLLFMGSVLKMRLNKINKNLKMVWQQLDDASGLLENAFNNLLTITNIPKDIKDKIEHIDFSAIISLKNDVEELIKE